MIHSEDLGRCTGYSFTTIIKIKDSKGKWKEFTKKHVVSLDLKGDVIK